VALFNALHADMIERGLAQHGQAQGGVSQGDHGVASSVFTALADLVATHPRMVTVFSMGANQSISGTDKGNAIINLHIATARINAPGMGPISITGQPDARCRLRARGAGALRNARRV